MKRLGLVLTAALVLCWLVGTSLAQPVTINFLNFSSSGKTKCTFSMKEILRLKTQTLK